MEINQQQEKKNGHGSIKQKYGRMIASPTETLPGMTTKTRIKDGKN